MANRLDLQKVLEELLGSKNVYFQPPESVKMKYPAIVYARKDIENTFADDSVYKQDYAYEIIVIDKDPDSDIPIKVSQLPRCRFDRHYKAANLNHYVLTLYF